MIFPDLLAGQSVFVDANIFIFNYRPDPVLGPACDQLLRRIENRDIQGWTSAHVLNEMAHRLIGPEHSVRRRRAGAAGSFGKSLARGW